MRLAPLLVLLLATTARGDDTAVEERVFIELVSARTTRFAGEATSIRVRVGYDTAWFTQHAVPLFRQEVDVPLHVRVPWLEGMEGFPELAALSPPSAGRGVTVAVNDALVEAVRVADVVRDGRTFSVFELVRRYAPSTPGELTLEAPSLRLAYATAFEEGFLDDRVPLDRREVTARGRPLALTVRALPLMGRPPAFIDAIGTFRATTRADATSVRVGETLRVTLVLEGDGNLERLTPPPGDRLRGFHVFGVLDDKGLSQRTLTYELAPLTADIEAVPALTLAFFQPTPPAGYRTIETAAIPLDVRATPGTPNAVPDAVAAPDAAPVDTVPSDAPRQARAPTPTLAIVLIGGLLLLFLGALSWAIVLRRRLAAERHALPDPQAARIREARDALHASLSRSSAERERALIDYLAAELHCAPAAVVSPGLEDRLVTAAVPAPLAARVADLLASLMAARYGAPPTDDGGTWDEHLPAALEAAFQDRTRT